MSTLRVIAGTARGQKLRSVPGGITRPITDRVKEALFNILGPDIHSAHWLDLFGGTGSVGIEALSRGAEFARFIDRHRSATQTIRTNLEQTRFSSKAEVLQIDAFTFLEREPDHKFDYIFIAPPQYKEMWIRALSQVDARPAWLVADAWVIVQIDPLEFKPVQLENLVEFDQRKYGSTLLVFYSMPEPEEF